MPFCVASAEQQAALLVRGQLGLRLRCHVVSDSPGAVRLRGRRGPPGPVEPQQRHGGATRDRKKEASSCLFVPLEADWQTQKKMEQNCMLGIFCCQVPTASVSVDGNPALNRIRWAPSGREIAVGDSDGRVLVYDIGEVSQLWFVFLPAGPCLVRLNFFFVLNYSLCI